MTDNFNMKQFLFENKLGAYSKLKESEITIGNYSYEKTGEEKDVREGEILRSGIPSGEYEIDGEMQKGFPKSVKPGLIFFLRTSGGMSRTSRQEEYISIPYIVKSDNGDGTWKCEKLKETKSETKEEGYMGTQYDSSEDMAVSMIKKDITETEKEEEAFGGVNENSYLMATNPDVKAKVDKVVSLLIDIDVDGETMEYILGAVGMDDQMANQLVHNKAELNKEAFGGKNKEGDALVTRFLQGIAKKFDYSIEDAALFVKNTIKSLGY